jgi:hypothetical protein
MHATYLCPRAEGLRAKSADESSRWVTIRLRELVEQIEAALMRPPVRTDR